MVDLVALVQAFAGLVSAAVANDVGDRDRLAVEHLLESCARVHALVEAVRLAAVSRLEALADVDGSLDPEATVAHHGRSGGREAQRTFRRARVLKQMEPLSDALLNGTVSGDHVDVIAQALSRLEPAERARLASEGAWIATVASHSTPEQLAKALRARVRQLSADDGLARLDRQRRATTLRGWIDPDTGMYRLSGEFDPEAGARIRRRLQQQIEALFHDKVPDTCPDDERTQGHLTALALLHLVAGDPTDGAGRGGSGRAEFLVVIDEKTLWHGLHGDSRIEIDGGFDLPLETLRRWACMADIIPVVLGGDGVVRDLGRSTRIASPSQRRAMRVMYSTCAIPGCCVAFDACQLHHVTYWRSGGRTDLDNFVPLCSRHHHCAHEGGWQLQLDSRTQVLRVTLPDGNTRANPPPYAKVA